MPLPESLTLRSECNAIFDAISSLKSAHSNPFNETRPTREEIRNLQLIHLVPGAIRIEELLDLYRFKVSEIGDEKDEKELEELEELTKKVGKEIHKFLEDERWEAVEQR
ncbi:hypothetical protein JCM3765_006564 [Sporobolomyces pararoseus]